MSKIEKEIIISIKKAIKEIFLDCAGASLSNVYLEIPKEKQFGDFSTNIAMRLAKDLKRPPIDVANELVDEINKGKRPEFCEMVKDIKIEKPGFVNFYLSGKGLIGSFGEIIMEKEKFGRLSIGNRRSVQIEFVSANPTGPLTVAHGRQAAVGDSLARILEFCGYKVVREYYINDEGVQMDMLGKSVKARAMERLGPGSIFPEDGYKGGYIYDIADEILRTFPKIKNQVLAKKNVPDSFFRDFACEWIMRMIKKDLDEFGVNFKVWYSQKKLSESGRIKKALSLLSRKGFLYEKDGAIWFRSTDFGDDKDRVIIKSDGSYTYLAPDIAYHREKFRKGYERVINILGPDHHGYVSRLKAACQALGAKKDFVNVLIVQLVTLYRDKNPVRMSTRQGEFITLRQVIDEVGRDAGRFFFIMRRTDSHLDFNLELAKAKTMDNPVYYIQYGHARISSVIEFGGNIEPDFEGLHLLDKQHEIDLIKALMQFPKVIESCTRNLEPYLLLSYLQDLASLFHSYYDSHRIVNEDKALTNARIMLVTAVKAVLFNGLTLLGVSAPQKM